MTGLADPDVRDRLRVDGSHLADVLQTLAWAVRNERPLADALVALKRFRIPAANPFIGLATFWIPWPLTAHWRSHNLSQARLQRTIRRLRDGVPLPDALAAGVGRLLPRHCLAAIQRAESPEQLAQILDLLASQAARDNELAAVRNRIIAICFFYAVPIYCGSVNLIIFRLSRLLRILGEEFSEVSSIWLQLCGYLVDHPALALLPAGCGLVLLTVTSASARPVNYPLLLLPILRGSARARVRLEAAELLHLGLRLSGDLVSAAKWAYGAADSGITRLALKRLHRQLAAGNGLARAWRVAGVGKATDVLALKAACAGERPQCGLRQVGDAAAVDLRRIARRNERWFPAVTAIGAAILIGIPVIAYWQLHLDLIRLAGAAV